ncbi:MAG: ribosome assembly cofactor RimP [Paludibacteraceae bacterium]|nr:ribosome assembly cofactor RimP [Paludibacteraceae bacterium]
MIQKEKVIEIVNDFLSNIKDVVLVDVKVSADNNISIELDSYEGVDLDLCAALNHYINEHLDREIEDYELEVGSVSLTDPFKTRMQYEKNLGHEVEVVLKEGKKLTGVLVEVNEDSFAVDVEEMVQIEGKKRKQKQIKTYYWKYAEPKSVRYCIKF